jgi:hypothetical protein
VLASTYFTKPYIFYQSVVGIVATWKVMEFNRDLGFQHIMMEGDALKIIHPLQKEWCCWRLGASKGI